MNTRFANLLCMQLIVNGTSPEKSQMGQTARRPTENVIAKSTKTPQAPHDSLCGQIKG